MQWGKKTRVKHNDILQWQSNSCIPNSFNNYWLSYTWGVVATTFTTALSIISNASSTIAWWISYVCMQSSYDYLLN